SKQEDILCLLSHGDSGLCPLSVKVLKPLRLIEDIALVARELFLPGGDIGVPDHHVVKVALREILPVGDKVHLPAGGQRFDFFLPVKDEARGSGYNRGEVISIVQSVDSFPGLSKSNRVSDEGFLRLQEVLDTSALIVEKIALECGDDEGAGVRSREGLHLVSLLGDLVMDGLNLASVWNLDLELIQKCQ